MGRSRPKISEALIRLEERGLVTDAESAVDGRLRLYELTDEGRAAAAR
ncbi:winged helix DNA-binding protein [Candidatus Poriferisodalis sp.]